MSEFTKDFDAGFWFAIQLIHYCVTPVDIEKVYSTLELIVSGDITIRPTPEDAIAAMEKETGNKMPQYLKDSIYQSLHTISEVIERDKNAAKFLLKE